MEDEIIINGVVYVKKLHDENCTGNEEFIPGCTYYVFESCNPDGLGKTIKEVFPERTSFWIGNKGRCGGWFLRIRTEEITVEFLEKLMLKCGDSITNIVRDSKVFYLLKGRFTSQK